MITMTTLHPTSLFGRESDKANINDKLCLRFLLKERDRKFMVSAEGDGRQLLIPRLLHTQMSDKAPNIVTTFISLPVAVLLL
jgi:hypothetical protein